MLDNMDSIPHYASLKTDIQLKTWMRGGYFSEILSTRVSWASYGVME